MSDRIIDVHEVLIVCSFVQLTKICGMEVERGLATS